MNQSNGNDQNESMNVDEYKIMEYTVAILSGWLSNNATSCKIDDIRSHVSKIYEVIADQIIGKRNSEQNRLKVKIEKTVYPDYIICLEDGKKLKMLKRHLWSRYKMTLDEYKKKWGLDYTYPTVAPNYAKKRSMIAKTIKKR